MVLFFLLFLISSNALSMQPTEIPTLKDLETSARDSLLRCNTIDAAITTVAAKLELMDASSAMTLAQKFPQWKEVISPQGAPSLYKSVGNTVAWISKKDPRICYYSTEKSDGGFSKITLSKPIESFEISPNENTMVLSWCCNFWVCHLNKHKTIVSGDTLHDESHKKSRILALQFANRRSCIAALDNNSFISFSVNNKKRDFSLPHTYCEKSKVQTMGVANKDCFISQHTTGRVLRHTRTTSGSRFNSLTYKPPQQLPALRTIVPINNGWLAEDNDATLYYYTINNAKGSFYTLQNYGTLLGKTQQGTVVIHTKSANPLPRLINLDPHTRRVINKTNLLPNTKAVPQAVQTTSNAKRDWFPQFLIHIPDNEKPTWTLLKKEASTHQQLAIRILLEEAFATKNKLVIDALICHETTNSFGNYMQKLLQAMYRLVYLRLFTNNQLPFLSHFLVS